MKYGELSERLWLDVIGRYDAPLRGYLRRTHAGADTVEEMLWDVWAVASEQDARIESPEDAWPALREAAREVAREYVQRARHERADENDALGEAAYVEPRAAADEEDAVQAMLDWQAAALAALSERQRTVVDLRYRYGVPDWLIAAVLEIREATVRVHAKRGLSGLRRFAKRCPPPPRERMMTERNPADQWEFGTAV